MTGGRRSITSLPRLIASDLDGTLLRSDSTVSRRTLDALLRARQAGMHVVLVTARPPRQLTVWRDVATAAAHVISVNGAVVSEDGLGRVVETHSMDPGAAGELVSRLRAAIHDALFAVEGLHGIANGIYAEPGFPALYPPSRCAPITELLFEPVLKLLVHSPLVPTPRAFDAVIDIVGRSGSVTYSSPTRPLEIMAPGVDKAAALTRLCRRLGVAMADVAAFGDMPNDLPMLRRAGRAWAVANAHPDVIAAAGETTLSNDEDGVAVILERFFGRG